MGRIETNKIIKDEKYFGNQKYLEKELAEIINGQANFVETDELEQRLENTIQRYENSI